MSADETNSRSIEVLAERIARERELREKLEKLIDERDLNYKDRIQVAIAAQKALTDAAFAASEKAIIKAEDSQKEYNVRSNEFRGQLDDQAKTLMPRLETDGRFAAMEQKLDEIKKDVVRMRDVQSQGSGRDHAMEQAEASAIASKRSLTVSILALAGMAVTIVLFLLKK